MSFSGISENDITAVYEKICDYHFKLDLQINSLNAKLESHCAHMKESRKLSEKTIQILSVDANKEQFSIFSMVDTLKKKIEALSLDCEVRKTQEHTTPFNSNQNEIIQLKKSIEQIDFHLASLYQKENSESHASKTGMLLLFLAFTNLVTLFVLVLTTLRMPT